MNLFYKITKWVYGLNLLILTLVACASSPKQSGDYEYDKESQADGASYTADSFTFKKDEPIHSEIKPWQFYFKKCNLTGESSYHSPTSYSCTGPFY